MIEAGELAKLEFPPVLRMLGPWLTQPSLGMVYGWRGSGKTWFSLAVAYAVAAGGKFLKWCANAPSRVVYVDGEMGRRSLQARQKKILFGADKEIEGETLFYSTFEDFRGVIPNLAEPRNWGIYDDMMRDSHLMILDNIGCTIRPVGKQSEVEAWAMVQQWAIQNRSQGKSILFVHHAGKSGQQLGTSTREQPLDYVIGLKRPPLHEAQDGCTFELYFEKNRDFWGEDAAPLAVQLKPVGEGLGWSFSALKDSRRLDVLRLYDQGFRVNEIAEQLGCNSGLVRVIINETMEPPTSAKEQNAYKDELF